MPTRPSASVAEAVAEVKTLLARATPAVLKAWAVEDKKKKKTGGVNAAFVKALASDVAELDAAMRAQSAKKGSAKAATAAEVRARDALRAPLKSIRDDVRETFPDDAGLQRAFGRGANLESDSTTLLVKAASGVVAAFETHRDAVASAGVHAARIAEVAELRDALEAADTTQRTDIGERIDATTAKTSLYKSILKRATQLRARLSRSTTNARGRSSLTRIRRRHSVKKRAKPPTGTPATGT